MMSVHEADALIMQGLLDVLGDYGIKASGVIHATGTVQLTLKGDYDKTRMVIGAFFDAAVSEFGGFGDDNV